MISRARVTSIGRHVSTIPRVCRYGNSCTPRVCRYDDFCVVLRPKGARPPPHSPEGGMKGIGRNERVETRYRCGIFSYFFSFFHFFHFLESPKRPWGEFFIIFFPVLLSRRSDPKATVRSLQRTDQRWPRGGVAHSPMPLRDRRSTFSDDVA